MRPELKKYFKKNNSNQLIYMGKQMKVIIPQRYTDKDLLFIDENVTSLGVFKMIVEGVTTGLTLPGMVEMSPSEVKMETHGDEKFVVGIFSEGDVFLRSTDIVRSDKLLYAMFDDAINLGRMPDFLTYDQAVNYFEEPIQLAKASFDPPPAIFELMVSHLIRDPNDPKKLYRYTKMTGDMLPIGLRNVTYGTQNTVSKMIGSRHKDSVASAVNEASSDGSIIEIGLRL